MTVEELLSRIGSRELTEWKIWMRIKADEQKKQQDAMRMRTGR